MPEGGRGGVHLGGVLMQLWAGVEFSKGGSAHGTVKSKKGERDAQEELAVNDVEKM